MTVSFDRQHWDRLGQPGLDRARYETWAEPPERWEETTERCLAEIHFERLVGERPNPTILDLGCGVGRVAIPLARANRSATIVAVDISPVMIGHALAEARAAAVGNIDWLIGDGRRLPGRVGWLTGAYSVTVFQHLMAQTVRDYIHEVGWRLIPGGRFRFQYVCCNGHLDDAEVQGWCREALLDVEEFTGSGLYDNWRWIQAVRL